MATGILIARGLGPAGQGEYAVLAAAVATGAPLGAVGQFHGNVLAAAGERAPSRVLLVRSLLHSCAVVGFLVVLLFVFGRFPIVNTAGVTAWLFLGVFTLETFSQMLRGVNLGRHHVTVYNLASLIQRVLFLLATVVGMVVVGRELNVVLAAWWIAVMVGVVVSGLWIWGSSTGEYARWRLVLRGWGATLLRGSRALTSVLLGLVLVRCDVYMLGPMLGIGTVGQFSVAQTLAEWLWYVPSILGNLLFAAVAADRGNWQVHQICRASRSLVALLLPSALVLAIIGRRVVHLLYGAAYDPASGIFLLLLPGMSALAIHLVVDAYFAGRAFPPISIWGVGCALTVKVGLNLIFVSHYGVRAAALATSAVYIGLLALKVVALSRAAKIPVSAILKPRWSDLVANLNTATGWVLRRP